MKKVTHGKRQSAWGLVRGPSWDRAIRDALSEDFFESWKGKYLQRAEEKIFQTGGTATAETLICEWGWQSQGLENRLG